MGPIGRMANFIVGIPIPEDAQTTRPSTRTRSPARTSGNPEHAETRTCRTKCDAPIRTGSNRGFLRGYARSRPNLPRTNKHGIEHRHGFSLKRQSIAFLVVSEQSRIVVLEKHRDESIGDGERIGARNHFPLSTPPFEHPLQRTRFSSQRDSSIRGQTTPAKRIRPTDRQGTARRNDSQSPRHRSPRKASCRFPCPSRRGLRSCPDSPCWQAARLPPSRTRTRSRLPSRGAKSSSMGNADRGYLSIRGLFSRYRSTMFHRTPFRQTAPARYRRSFSLFSRCICTRPSYPFLAHTRIA